MKRKEGEDGGKAQAKSSFIELLSTGKIGRRQEQGDEKDKKRKERSLKLIELDTVGDVKVICTPAQIYVIEKMVMVLYICSQAVFSPTEGFPIWHFKEQTQIHSRIVDILSYPCKLLAKSANAGPSEV